MCRECNIYNSVTYTTVRTRTLWHIAFWNCVLTELRHAEAKSKEQQTGPG